MSPLGGDWPRQSAWHVSSTILLRPGDLNINMTQRRCARALSAILCVMWGSLAVSSLRLGTLVARSTPAISSGLVGALRAGEAAAPQTNEVGSVLSRQIADIQTALADARAQVQAVETNTPAGSASRDALVRRTLLQRLVRIYEQQLSSLAELEAAKARHAEQAREAQNWSGFAQTRPYSILQTESLREEIQAEELRMKSDERALTIIDALIGEQRVTLKQAEERIRQLNEQLESSLASARGSDLSTARELERVRSQVAAAAVALLELEREIRQENLAASHSHVQLLHRQRIIAAADTSFTQADLDKILGVLGTERREMERALAEAEPRHRDALAAWEALRAAANSPGGAPPPDLVELRSAQLESASTALRTLRLRLEASSIEQVLWEVRFAAYGTQDFETLRQSFRQLESLSRRIALWRDFYRQRLDVSSSQVALQKSRLNALGSGFEPTALPRERLALLQQRDQSLLSMERQIEALDRLLKRWGEDLQNDMGKLPWLERVRSLFSNARSFLSNLWRFELFTAEDTIVVDGQKISGRRSVTVGKTLAAILILVVGYWITGLIARMGSQLFEKLLHSEAYQRELIRRWMRAGLVVCLLMFSVVSVKIPLTVFAFAGGALAIGIGFGTQTILKNVVSGLIILFERPFRVGDVLDVAGQRGTLTSIGLRACVLQLWDGTETLFPNSSLLENALTNWTYSNRVVRFTLTLGIAYGSDTRQVVKLLEQILARHGQLEEEPKPQVFFTDFGPSSLTFEVRFWLDVMRTNPAQISSDLRHMIASAFAEHGIVIAFPQQDLHLDTLRPLQVQMLPKPSPPPSRGDGQGEQELVSI